MRLPARIGAWLLPFVLTGCFHRAHTDKSLPTAPQLPTPRQAAPQPEPQMPEPAPEPVAPPEAPKPQAETAPAPVAPDAGMPKPPARHAARKSSSSHPQMAANGTPGVSAIGLLSSGDPGDNRRQTEEQMVAIERGLKSIRRPLNDQEQRTVAHIREFLKQARQAMASGDLDGAHTLAAKAKVLLSELAR